MYLQYEKKMKIFQKYTRPKGSSRNIIEKIKKVIDVFSAFKYVPSNSRLLFQYQNHELG